ncbi:unnamed protein product [Bathycoccus prasinos]
MAPPGVAALRSGRNKGNVRYANDEEGFGGAALSNTTLASEDEEEDEDDEDEDEEEEEDSESEGEEDGDDEEEDSGSENKRAKKKQRIAAPNGENNKKRKRAEIKKKEFESAVKKINDNKVLANAKKKANENNFREGSGAYVALVVLLAGKAVGIKSMTPTTIEEFASQLSLEGETKNGKKTKMDRHTISKAMERDEINFKRNRDGTYSLADKLEKLENKTMKEGRMEEIESAVKKINDNKVLANAKKKAIEFNFTVGSGAYVALVVLLAGKAVGIKSMTPTTIEEFASQLSLEGETKNGKKTKMDRHTISKAMERDEINFKRNRDGTYSLADKLEKLENKTMKEGRMEEIESAVKKINDNKVLANAKKKAIEFNFTVGSGAYVALVVLLAGKAVGIKSMTPTTIEEFASQLSLEGETKNGKKTKMDRHTISKAMERDEINFKRNEDGTYSLANKLEKKKETKKKKETRERFHVQKNNWDAEAGKFPGIKFFDEKEWCPLCNGRTVVRDGSDSYLLFFSHDYLWNQTKRLQESARGGNEVTIEAFRVILRSYFERKLHKESCVTDFKSFQRVDGHICYDCLIAAENYFKVEIEQN